MNVQPVALVLALNGLDYDRRVANEARSLATAGFQVTRVGVRMRAEHGPRESSDFDDIIRMSPPWYPVQPSVREEHVAPPASTRTLARQWGWKVRLMGWFRRRFTGTLAGVDALREWLRWNKALTATCREFTPDVVLATDFDTVLTGWRLKRRTACFLVYDAHELWVDMPSRARLSALARACFILIERFLARRADLCMTVGEGLADVMERRLSIPRPLVVHNGPELILPPNQSRTGPLRVLFQGRIEQGRGLEEALDAMRRLKDSVTLTIQGFGPSEGDLREAAVALGLDGCTVGFIPPCAPEDVSKCANPYDVGLVSVQPTCLNNVLSMPNKLFTFLGGSLAILTTREAPEISRLVERYRCGRAVEEWSSRLVVEALEWMESHRDEVLQMKQKAHRAALDLTWDKQFAPVVRVLTAKSDSIT